MLTLTMSRPNGAKQGRKLSAAVVCAAVALTFGAGTAAARDIDSLPISQALLERDVGAVRRLVQQGQDLDQRLFNGATPAITAALGDSWDIVLYLIQAGADPSLQDRMGITVAKMAATSRVAPGTREHAALTEVRRILKSRGLR